jgi:hypothetical protein
MASAGGLIKECQTLFGFSRPRLLKHAQREEVFINIKCKFYR